MSEVNSLFAECYYALTKNMNFFTGCTEEIRFNNKVLNECYFVFRELINICFKTVVINVVTSLFADCTEQVRVSKQRGHFICRKYPFYAQITSYNSLRSCGNMKGEWPLHRLCPGKFILQNGTVESKQPKAVDPCLLLSILLGMNRNLATVGFIFWFRAA